MSARRSEPDPCTRWVGGFASGLLALWLTACSAPVERPTAGDARPQRIVSMDYCADQYVLKFADPGQIVALSRDAGRDFSYMRKAAAGFPTVRATATEDVLALQPDLVVRSYGGGPNAAGFLERAGVRVHQIGWGDDYEAVRGSVRAAAAAMGQVDKGEAVVAEFDDRLKALQNRPATGLATLYLTPSGVSAGPNTMIDRFLRTAGLTNFNTRPGWNTVSLERLVHDAPAMVATAFFGAAGLDRDPWTPVRHPILTRQLQEAPVARLDGATTSCGGWFILDAVETLEATAHEASR